MTTYITVAIPYVNAVPHLGYAFELVEADVAARARRALGEPVRFLGGTDEYSLKNVLAADAVGEPTEVFVARHADRFESLATPLGISFDDFIRTSRDPRHRPAVERLWRRCAAAGDLYQREYTGSYCLGCERFYDAAELVNGRCPEHVAPVETVSETNWFFRLSRYTDRLRELIERDELHVAPAAFRAEVLAFVRGGLDDISVSRSVQRARGWGIPVPDDPTQVIYVWFDALTNYLSALDYGTGGDACDRWWRRADERIHVVGKGIIRFHAVYWPAFLLSAGEPLPTRVQVHPYLSVDGAKISKSAGNQLDPTALVGDHGLDALRWWLASDVAAVADTDFTTDRLTRCADETLANGLGNAVSRIATLRHRTDDVDVLATDGRPLTDVVDLLAPVAAELAHFDRRAATGRIVAAIDALNRSIEATAPWRLARDPEHAGAVRQVLADHSATARLIALALGPITPDLSARALAALDADPACAPAAPVQPRLVGRDPVRR